jgi:hypothetical protein
MGVDVDARLREYAQRWREAQPVTHLVPDLDRATSTPSRPARLRMVVAVAASAVAVAVVALGVVVLNASHDHRLSVSHSTDNRPAIGAHIPWNGSGVYPDTGIYRAATRAVAPAGLRLCANADLRVESAHTSANDSGNGWLTTTFVLRSVAADPCSLGYGFGDIELFAADGTALPIDAIPSGGAAIAGSALFARPGQLISGTATWAVYEGRAPRPTRLVINLDRPAASADDPLSVSVAAVTIPPHPEDPSNIGPWRATSYGEFDQVVDPGTLASLTVAVSAPTTIVIGTNVRYSVTLTNPTSTAVPLTPCPDFAQRIDVVPLKVATTVEYRGPLNCAPAPTTLAPGDSVTFDYQLDTSGEVPGPGTLTWQLVDGSTAAVTSNMRVELTH